MNTPTFTCGACGESTAAPTIIAEERMFGFGNRFDYFECTGCGCLQLRGTVTDLARYYPSNYYSFSEQTRKRPLMQWLEQQRNRRAVVGTGWLGALLLQWKPHAPLESLRRLDLRAGTRILDVGCGGGELLLALRDLGFRSLSGVDPNIAADIGPGNGIHVRKREIQDLDGNFDVVMFHHSLEHIPDQVGALRAAARLLAPGGRCLVRIPLAGQQAWKEYGVHWSQLDAPRHLFLHTCKSLGRLAERTGFCVVETVFDSNEFQFWGSECLKRGIPLFDPATGRPNPQAVQIRQQGARAWRKQARALNAAGQGDQGCFVLERNSPVGASTA